MKHAVERGAIIDGAKILLLHRSGCGAVNDLSRMFRAVIVWMTPALPPRRPEISGSVSMNRHDEIPLADYWRRELHRRQDQLTQQHKIVP